MAKKTDKNIPVKAETTGVPMNPLEGMEQDSGKGFEGADEQSYALPFLGIIQKMSPQVDEDSPAFDPAAAAGMLFNSVIGKFIDGEVGVRAIQFHYKRSIIHWGDRDSGGGFIEELPIDTLLMAQTKKNEKGQDVLEDGTYLVDTRHHYCLVEDKDTEAWLPVVIAMSSTQNKKSRQWMSKLSSLMVKGKERSFNPPTFGQMFRLTTVGESNSKGTWKGWKIEFDGLVQDAELYASASNMHERAVAGGIKVAQDTATDDTDVATDTEKF